MSKQFLLFLLCGGMAAFVNLGSRIIYNHWLNFSNSVILAYVTGMITAFLLIRSLVFNQTTQSFGQSILFFILVNGIAILQTWAISMSLVYFALPFFGITLFAKEMAHLIGVIVPVLTSYVGHKYFSFKS